MIDTTGSARRRRRRVRAGPRSGASTSCSYSQRSTSTVLDDDAIRAVRGPPAQQLPAASGCRVACRSSRRCRGRERRIHRSTSEPPVRPRATGPARGGRRARCPRGPPSRSSGRHRGRPPPAAPEGLEPGDVGALVGRAKIEHPPAVGARSPECGPPEQDGHAPRRQWTVRGRRDAASHRLSRTRGASRGRASRRSAPAPPGRRHRPAGR